MAAKVQHFWRWFDQQRGDRSIRELEKLAQVPRSRIGNPYSAKRSPSLQVCEAVAKGLGVELAEVLRQAEILDDNFPKFTRLDQPLDVPKPSQRKRLSYEEISRTRLIVRTEDPTSSKQELEVSLENLGLIGTGILKVLNVEKKLNAIKYLFLEYASQYNQDEEQEILGIDDTEGAEPPEELVISVSIDKMTERFSRAFGMFDYW